MRTERRLQGGGDRVRVRPNSPTNAESAPEMRPARLGSTPPVTAPVTSCDP